MKTMKKVTSAIAAAAMVASVGVLSAGSAQAAPNPKSTISGSSDLAIPPGVVSTASKAGVTFGVRKGATKSTDPSTGYLNMVFQITGAPTDGYLQHSGVLVMRGSNTGAVVKFRKPAVGWTTDNTGIGDITGKIAGLDSDYANLNGQRVELFDLVNVETTTNIGSVRPRGKKFKRVDKMSLTAIVNVTNDDDVLNALDGTLGAPLFQGGENFGQIASSYKIVTICATRQQCTL